MDGKHLLAYHFLPVKLNTIYPMLCFYLENLTCKTLFDLPSRSRKQSLLPFLSLCTESKSTSTTVLTYYVTIPVYLATYGM